MKLGAATVLCSVRQEVEIARACEAASFWGFGLGDTAPRLYQDAYVTATACLEATARLHVGPLATNPVSRHWSVLGASARTLDELAPGRFFAAVGTGDGALHSVGLQPASWSRLERELVSMRDLAPADLELHVVASGPRGAEVAGRIATDLVLGTGLDPHALRALSARARAARVDAGISSPLRIWALVDCFLAEGTEAARQARWKSRPRANGYARFSFGSTFTDKAIPEPWQPCLRERFARYDFGSHGLIGETPNATLFDDEPEIQEYILDRFTLIGTPEDCAHRLRTVASDAGLDGAWLSIGPSALLDDPVEMVRRLGAPFVDLVGSD